MVTFVVEKKIVEQCKDEEKRGNEIGLLGEWRKRVFL